MPMKTNSVGKIFLKNISILEAQIVITQVLPECKVRSSGWFKSTKAKANFETHQ